jgi:hypothetical protein
LYRQHCRCRLLRGRGQRKENHRDQQHGRREYALVAISV